MAQGVGTAVAHPIKTAGLVESHVVDTLAHGSPGDIAYGITSTAITVGPAAVAAVGKVAALVRTTEAVGEAGTVARTGEALATSGQRTFSSDDGLAVKDNGSPAKDCVGEGCGVPGQCFAAGTLVDTEEGLRPIEGLRAGDRVLARDPTTGAMAYEPVLRTIVTEHRALDEITLVSAAGTENLRVTPNHPFFVVGRGWVETSDLSPEEDTLSTESGEPAHIEVARSLVAGATVYNLEVSHFHTYFVGRSHAWVHNQTASACPIVLTADRYAKLFDSARSGTLPSGVSDDGVTQRPGPSAANGAAPLPEPVWHRWRAPRCGARQDGLVWGRQRGRG